MIGLGAGPLQEGHGEDPHHHQRAQSGDRRGAGHTTKAPELIGHL